MGNVEMQEMSFCISKRKNSLLLVGALLCFFLICISMILLLSASMFETIVIAVISLICFVVGASRIIYDYKTTITISESGIVMFRRGKHYNVLWKDIKRIEYSGVKCCKIFDTLLIHTNHNVLYVEYTFEDYGKIWATIQQHLTQNVYSAIIDKDIPQRA